MRRRYRLGLFLVCASAALAADGAIPPGVRPRLAWGAAAAGPGTVAQVPRRITVHHTESHAAGTAEAQVATHLRGIQRYHQTEKHWPDLAYHLLIDPTGRVWEGRNLAQRGDSGTVYDLSDRALVCLIGKFNVDPLGDTQWTALVETVGWLCRRHGIPTTEITMHRQLAQTDCPGDHVAAKVTDGSLKRAVDAWLQAHPASR